MSLEQRLRDVRTSGRKILAPYLTAGFPSAAAFGELVQGIVAAGADMLEIGIPFTDPLMDGPVIQEASRRALEQEIRPSVALRLMDEIRLDVPFVLMTYANPVLQMGWEPFAHAAARSGASGVIIPDLPPEEAAEWAAAAARCDLSAVFLVAPTSSSGRIAEAVRLGSGFVYCVSLLGVTGVRDTLSQHAEPLVGGVRRLTDRPALVGVGVSTPEHAAAACAFADGVIVGSAVVRALMDSGPRAACALVAEMRQAMDRVAVRPENPGLR